MLIVEQTNKYHKSEEEEKNDKKEERKLPETHLASAEFRKRKLSKKMSFFCPLYQPSLWTSIYQKVA